MNKRVSLFQPPRQARATHDVIHTKCDNRDVSAARLGGFHSFEGHRSCIPTARHKLPVQLCIRRQPVGKTTGQCLGLGRDATPRSRAVTHNQQTQIRPLPDHPHPRAFGFLQARGAEFDEGALRHQHRIERQPVQCGHWRAWRVRVDKGWGCLVGHGHTGLPEIRQT